jgi:NAD(P)-dependent dehydrogenase (short-subunit alcohol dehydrogenase family)
VNAVAPGVIDTPWWHFLPEDQRQAVFSEYGAKTPVGRIGRPEEVAEGIASLVTNGFITGQVLTVDGGLRYAA